MQHCFKRPVAFSVATLSTSCELDYISHEQLGWVIMSLKKKSPRCQKKLSKLPKKLDYRKVKKIHKCLLFARSKTCLGPTVGSFCPLVVQVSLRTSYCWLRWSPVCSPGDLTMSRPNQKSRCFSVISLKLCFVKMMIKKGKPNDISC